MLPLAGLKKSFDFPSGIRANVCLLLVYSQSTSQFAQHCIQIPTSQILIFVQYGSNMLLRCSNSAVAGSNFALGTDKTVLS